MTYEWTKGIKPDDFTACIELMSLLNYVDAWLSAPKRPTPTTEPIRALSRARKLLIHTKPDSPIITRLMRNEWLHSRYARAALTYKHPNTSMGWVPTSAIKKHLLSRPRLGLLLDLDSRLGRSSLLTLEVTEIIADSDTHKQRKRDQAMRLLQRAELLLSLDFDQMQRRVSAFSQKLVMSTHRRWDYSQSRIKYWDQAFSLQRKLLKLLEDALTQTHNPSTAECLDKLYGRIVSTAHEITTFELKGASQELDFHFPEIINDRGADDVYS